MHLLLGNRPFLCMNIKLVYFESIKRVCVLLDNVLLYGFIEDATERSKQLAYRGVFTSSGVQPLFISFQPHTINLSKGNIEFITRVTHQRIKGVFIDRQITQPLHLLHLRKQPTVHFRNSSPLGLLFNSLCQRSRGILFAFSHHIDNQCVVLRHFRSNQFVNHYFIGTVSFGLILLEIPELR